MYITSDTLAYREQAGKSFSDKFERHRSALSKDKSFILIDEEKVGFALFALFLILSKPPKSRKYCHENVQTAHTDTTISNKGKRRKILGTCYPSSSKRQAIGRSCVCVL